MLCVSIMALIRRFKLYVVLFISNGENMKVIPAAILQTKSFLWPNVLHFSSCFFFFECLRRCAKLFCNIITYCAGLKWMLGSGYRRHVCVVLVYTNTKAHIQWYPCMMETVSACVLQVEFSADTLRLNLIDLARTGSKFIQVAGRVAYTCPAGDPQDPVTFTTRDSHLVSIELSIIKHSANCRPSICCKHLKVTFFFFLFPFFYLKIFCAI